LKDFFGKHKRRPPLSSWNESLRRSFGMSRNKKRRNERNGKKDSLRNMQARMVFLGRMSGVVRRLKVLKRNEWRI